MRHIVGHREVLLGIMPARAARRIQRTEKVLRRCHVILAHRKLDGARIAEYADLRPAGWHNRAFVDVGEAVLRIGLGRQDQGRQIDRVVGKDRRHWPSQFQQPAQFEVQRPRGRLVGNKLYVARRQKKPQPVLGTVIDNVAGGEDKVLAFPFNAHAGCDFLVLDAVF